MAEIQDQIEQTFPTELQFCDCVFKIFIISVSSIVPVKPVIFPLLFCCCRSERSLLNKIFYFYYILKNIYIFVITLKHHKQKLIAYVHCL